MRDALYTASRWFLVRAGRRILPARTKNHLLAYMHEGGDTARIPPHSLDTCAMTHLHVAVTITLSIVIIRLEALEYYLNIVFLRINIGEVLNQLQYIAGDIRRVLGVDRDLRAGANILQRLLNSRLVQERHLFRQIQRNFVGLRKLLTAEVVGALLLPCSTKKILIARPMPTPSSRSNTTTATSVAANGMNWYRPLCQKWKIVFGLASL